MSADLIRQDDVRQEVMNKLLISLIALVILIIGIFLVSMPQKSPSLAQADAIQAVIAAHPELEAYKTTSLPPSSIEAKPAPDGWYVGFIQSGSGLPGILHAQCYQVSSASNIEQIGQYFRGNDPEVASIDLATCTPVFASPSTTGPVTGESEASVLPYGNVTLKLNERAIFNNISIRPISIEEDSRCPSDVQCIQAGTVRVKVQVVSGMGTSVSILKLGQVFTTEGEAITLTNVLPNKKSTVPISDNDYRLTFNVVPQGTPVANNPIGKCYVGGCSAQLCTDQPDMISTCEYSARYACYKTAPCERQASGMCGWTPTQELNSCLVQS